MLSKIHAKTFIFSLWLNVECQCFAIEEEIIITLLYMLVLQTWHGGQQSSSEDSYKLIKTASSIGRALAALAPTRSWRPLDPDRANRLCSVHSAIQA